MHLEDAFPNVRLLGPCTDCTALVLDCQPHEWAHPDTNRMMWPVEPGASLYCGYCSSRRDRSRKAPA